MCLVGAAEVAVCAVKTREAEAFAGQTVTLVLVLALIGALTRRPYSSTLYRWPDGRTSLSLCINGICHETQSCVALGTRLLPQWEKLLTWRQNLLASLCGPRFWAGNVRSALASTIPRV